MLQRPALKGEQLIFPLGPAAFLKGPSKAKQGCRWISRDVVPGAPSVSCNGSAVPSPVSALLRRCGIFYFSFLLLS